MSTQSPRRPLALAIHGGAGVIDMATLGEATAQRIHADLERALDAGHAVLTSGGSALDAVEATVCVLEDAPYFNAGHGAVFTADGRHELDASIMDGHHRRAGAVAGVSSVRNPVRLARRVLEDSPHVFLVGDGAEQFADLHPEIERVPNDWFSTEARRLQLLEAQRQEQQTWQANQDLRGRYFGTVGAVALDSRGHLAAATSTGGMTNKRWGRVGDSPLIGAGTGPMRSAPCPARDGASTTSATSSPMTSPRACGTAATACAMPPRMWCWAKSPRMAATVA